MKILYTLLASILLPNTLASLTPTFQRTSSWVGGICGTLTLWNRSPDIVTSWKIDLTSNNPTQHIIPTLDEVWGCSKSFDSLPNDNTVSVQNLPGSSIFGWSRITGFGFCMSFSPEVNGDDVTLLVSSAFPNVSPTPNPVVTPSPNPVVTPSPNPTVTPSPNPTVTPSPNPVVTPSPNPVVTPSPSLNTGWVGGIITTRVSEWDGGICFNIRIHNTGNSPANEWMMTMDVSHPTENVRAVVSEVWEAAMVIDTDIADGQIYMKSAGNIFIHSGEVVVGPGFCMDYNPSKPFGEITTSSTINFNYDDNQELNNTDPYDTFTSELRNATWDGEVVVRMTGGWEGGLCNTIRIVNLHPDYIATSFRIVSNVTHSSLPMVAWISDVWSAISLLDDNTNDGVMFVGNEQGFTDLYPGRSLVGPGFCVSYNPSLPVDGINYTVSVELSGQYWTSPPLQSYPPVHAGGLNSMYLPHGYFIIWKSDSFIRHEVLKLKELNVKYQYANLAMFNMNGHIPDVQYNQLAHWVRVSKVTDPNQLVIAHVNGHRDPHVWNTNIHSAMAYTCLNILHNTGVDGFHFDFEPPRSDPEMGLFLEKVRSVVGESVYLSVAGSGAPFRWSADHIRLVAKYVDAVCPMLYDNSQAITTVSGYKAWVRDAVLYYQAVYKSPESRVGVEVHPILPAYQANNWHDPLVENMENAISGVMMALSKGARVDGIGVWWWFDMTPEDKDNMKTQFIQVFGQNHRRLSSIRKMKVYENESEKDIGISVLFLTGVFVLLIFGSMFYSVRRNAYGGGHMV